MSTTARPPDAQSGVPAAPARLALLFACLCLASCSGLVHRFIGGSMDVAVTVAGDLNDDFPVSVDLVVAYDEKAMQRVAGLDAADWFAGRAAYERDLLGKIQVSSWEWVPGQVVAEQEVDLDRGPKGAVLFASYYSEGEHRAVIDPIQDFALELGAEGFRVELDD